MAAQSEATFAEFIRYNNWANRQVLEACRQLSEDQLASAYRGRTARSATLWSTSSAPKQAMSGD